MTVSVFASGSGGNCLLLSEGDTYLLIDAGISARKIQSFLSQHGLCWSDISGVLITHEHSDHIYGLETIAKNRLSPVFAPHTVANRLLGRLPSLEGLLRIVPVGEEYFTVGGLRVRAFHTVHDTDESVGYRVEGERCFAIATDTGCVTDEIRKGLAGAETVVLEANHDPEMLRNGPYPFPLKRRILSEHGHLSNEQCAALAAELAPSGTKRIILGHLSKENNRPSLAMQTVGLALAGTDTALYCAPPLGPLTICFSEDTACCT